MRLSDIDQQLHESVNEAPVGLLTRAGNAIKAKMGGATGAAAKGAQDSSTLANSLYKDFYIHAGKQGVKKPNLDFLVDYLQQVGFAPNTIAHIQQGVDPHFELGTKQVGQIILKAVQKRASNQQKLGKTVHKKLEPNSPEEPQQQQPAQGRPAPNMTPQQQRELNRQAWMQS